MDVQEIKCCAGRTALMQPGSDLNKKDFNSVSILAHLLVQHIQILLWDVSGKTTVCDPWCISTHKTIQWPVIFRGLRRSSQSRSQSCHQHWYVYQEVEVLTRNNFLLISVDPFCWEVKCTQPMAANASCAVIEPQQSSEWTAQVASSQQQLFMLTLAEKIKREVFYYINILYDDLIMQLGSTCSIIFVN